ncbi:MAG: DNA repair protein RecN [Myxococcota bacterium]
MLSHLVIKNFAIIEHLEIPFHEGFTALTGETGAGKSIIIDALNLLLGGRASTDVIRTDTDQAVVEAIFEPSPKKLAAINESLAEQGIDEGGELLVRRIVSRSGRNKVFINGCLSTVSALDQATRGLVDISGQHEHYSLLDEDAHLSLLDGFADVDDELEEMSNAYSRVASLRRELKRIREGVQERLSRIDFLEFQLDELETAELEPGEEDDLRADLDTLKHAEKITEAARSASYLCYDADESAVERLSEAVEALERVAEWAPQLGDLAERLEDARISAEEVAREVAHYGQEVDDDPNRLDAVVERLEIIKRLKRKHGVAEIEQLIDKTREMREELHDLQNAEERGEGLQEELEQARAEALEVGLALSRKRREAAELLRNSIENELGDLNMVNTRLVFSFEPATLEDIGVDSLDAAADDEDATRVRLSADGLDTVRLLISPNLGEEPRPLAKIASGGELSRIMLAIKSVLVERDAVGLYIFDEVDTGIGGQTADIVGDKIRRTSRSHQVICITHLPQICSKADQHYLVEKMLTEGRTQSRIRPLDEDERVEEIARMLGGTRVTTKTREAARELLG